MTKPTKIKIKFFAFFVVDHTGVGPTYVALGEPITKTAIMSYVTSTFDKPVMLTLNPIEDQTYIREDSINYYPLGVAQGTQFYVKQGPSGAPTSGDLFITIIESE